MLKMVYDNETQRGDLDRTGGNNFIEGLDLETAVLISVFTDRRAEPSDEYGKTNHYKGGWWGSITELIGREMGSRLWLLRREKLTQSNLNLAKAYLEECLQWMLDDSVAESIVVTTWRGNTPTLLCFKIEIERPGDVSPWARAWEIQTDAL
ncbi:phage GP46 family protein [Candidatus Pacearchaeota archaeon]|nr:phage GP46 family protein [Candidatus Pacearchaeota archaeon]